MAFEMINPLDYLILGALPEAGSLVLGVYPDGRSSAQLAEDTLHKAVNATHVGRRLAELHKAGLVTTVRTPKNRNSSLVWQRTPAGKRVYKEWKGDES